MTKLFLFLTGTLFLCSAAAQYTSIHHQELEYYNSQHKTTEWYEQNVNPVVHGLRAVRAKCNLNKVVYGWHPYWNGSTYKNYDWDLISHFSFFLYEVDPYTGAAIQTHDWETSEAVDSALANGVKVILTAGIFGSGDVANFLANPSAKQNLIDSLISTVQDRGAHGVTIDFEFVPFAQKRNFTNFMVALAKQMHTAIPGSEVSTMIPNVDWSDSYDLSGMDAAIDYFIIMGYGYFWSGSSTTGPTDPLYFFDTHDRSIARSITDIHHAGASKNKMVLGLPYYGQEWPTVDLNIPSTTTGTGSAVRYLDIKDNVGGNYIPANHSWDADSYSDIYTFNEGQNTQCMISLEDAFGKRLEHVNTAGIAGIGIWALGYDDGYTEMWSTINDYLTDCYEDPCHGSIHDFGGPTRDYNNHEDYTWTISPPNAATIDFTFTMFDVELDADSLFIYDGNSTAAPLIGSYTGTHSPGSFSSTTGDVTFRFKSDFSTVGPGWLANYTCIENQLGLDVEVAPTYKVYPNPFTNEIFVRGDLSDLKAVKLFDTSGKEIEIDFYESTGAILLSQELVSGMYILELSSQTRILRSILIRE